MLRTAISVLLLGSLMASPAVAQFTEWSAKNIQNLGSPINTSAAENCVSISKDALTLYFARNTGSYDLYFSTRAALDKPWSNPQPVPNVNTSSQELCPALSLDEHSLYFTSDRPNGCGSYDIYVSRRQNRRDNLGWKPPVNLGCEKDGHVNSSGDERTPYFFEDESGRVVMYFSSYRSAATGFDIYASYQRDDDTFGPGTLVSELNTAWNEMGPTVRRDGLEMYFDSNRPGGLGARDIWVSKRNSTSDKWSPPGNVTILNSKDMDGARMSLSFDGRMLFFSSMRPGETAKGSWDIYVATRERLPEKK